MDICSEGSTTCAGTAMLSDCVVKEGQSAAYESICAQATDEASCQQLETTCSWVGGGYILTDTLGPSAGACTCCTVLEATQARQGSSNWTTLVDPECIDDNFAPENYDF